jgi:sec-independent protein translocase protein TatA
MSIGIWQIVLVALVLLLLFGSRKLPALGAELGRGLRDLRGHLAAKRTAAAEDAPFDEPSPGERGGLRH